MFANHVTLDKLLKLYKMELIIAFVLVMESLCKLGQWKRLLLLNQSITLILPNINK